MSNHHFISAWHLPAALLLLLMVPAAAHAQKTMLATCTGQGASFLLTQLSESDAALVFGLSAPPAGNAVLVVSKDGSEARWSTDSRANIDRECGGDGSDEITLFQPIQPRDGTWSIKMSNNQLHGCSGMMGSAIKKSMNSVMGKKNSDTLRFDDPFHPRPLLAKSDKEIRWAQTGLNSWHAVLTQQGGSDAMAITVTVDAEVHSPVRITEKLTFKIKMSPDLARIMGGSGDCRATAMGELDWVK